MISEVKAAELVISGITVALTMMNEECSNRALIGSTMVEADRLGRVGHAVVRWSITVGYASPKLLTMGLLFDVDVPTADDFDMATRLFAAHSDRAIADAACQLLTRVRFEVA